MAIEKHARDERTLPKSPGEKAMSKQKFEKIVDWNIFNWYGFLTCYLWGLVLLAYFYVTLPYWIWKERIVHYEKLNKKEKKK